MVYWTQPQPEKFKEAIRQICLVLNRSTFGQQIGQITLWIRVWKVLGSFCSEQDKTMDLLKMCEPWIAILISFGSVIDNFVRSVNGFLIFSVDQWQLLKFVKLELGENYTYYLMFSFVSHEMGQLFFSDPWIRKLIYSC